MHPGVLAAGVDSLNVFAATAIACHMLVDRPEPLFSPGAEGTGASDMHGKEKVYGSIPVTGLHRNSLRGQVRSSLDSSHPTLRMGAVSVLGGIWEIASRRASEAGSALPVRTAS
jgi:hypothetical protein